LLVRGYKGKEADRLVTRIDHGVVSLVAGWRGHERQAAEELGQGKTRGEERKVIDASQAAITCRKPSTGCAPWGACPSIPRQCRAHRRATAGGWRDLMEWDPRRAKRRRSDRHRTSGAEMPDVPGGASGLLCRGYKGKKADRLATRTAPGVSLVSEIRGHERQAAEELGQRKTVVEEPKPPDASAAAITQGPLVPSRYTPLLTLMCVRRAVKR
jgi:hypothetical protein